MHGVQRMSLHCSPSKTLASGMCSLSTNLGKDPLSGMPIFDPSACTRNLQTALWRAYCDVATTVNKRVLGQTDEALEELRAQLRDHVARPAKRPRASCDNEATDVDNEETGQQPGVKRQHRSSVDAEGCGD